MSSFLYRLGLRAVAARRAVVTAWVAALLLAGAGVAAVGINLDNDVSIPGTEAQAALDRLAQTFPQVSGASAQVVVVAAEGSTVTEPALREAVEGVASVITPFDELVTGTLSEDERAGIITVQLSEPTPAVTDETKEALHQATEDLSQALPEGAVASLGGQVFSTEFPEMTLTEATGLAVALVVLVLTLGSLVAAGMPLLNALLGVGISVGLTLVVAKVVPITSTTPMLSLMLGLAVGIDYALFIVSRHRELLAEGMTVREAAARATGTAGSAVVFAGLTVMIALVGLGVAGIPFLTTMGVAASVSVAFAVAISVTLTPALLGAAGERLRPTARPAADEDEDEQQDTQPAPARRGFFGTWVHLVTRAPALTIVLVVAGVALLTLPAKDLRLALPDAGALPADHHARQTYDLVSEHFGPGANGPLVVTGSIVTSTDPLGLMDKLAEEIRQIPGVDSVPLATPNESADTGIIQVVPTTAPEAEETAELVRAIRAKHDYFLEKYDVDLAVTGFTAVGIDVSTKLGGALLPFSLVVVGLSLVLLTMVFRSVAVPVKATLGYLFSVGSAFGVVTLVFEKGWFASILHVDHVGPVISFMPIVVMGVLFGLAMDYEVFLVSRMREDYVHGGDARHAVQTGFRGAATVVTAAAVIMAAVFIAFVPEGDSNIKPIALGLAVGVTVDAFVVRMVLVPAVMQLLGEKAWWIPRWLDKLLPSFDVEGAGVHRELELASWPEPGADDAVAAEALLAPHGTHPVTVRLPRGGVLLVAGEEAGEVSGLLLALTGRVEPQAGTVKVDGLVLPERAGTVRRRSGYVNLDLSSVAAVAEAAAEAPAVLAVDRAELVGDPARRERLARHLTRAHAQGTTLLVGAVGPAVREALRELAPAGATVRILDLHSPVPDQSALTPAAAI